MFNDSRLLQFYKKEIQKLASKKHKRFTFTLILFKTELYVSKLLIIKLIRNC